MLLILIIETSFDLTLKNELVGKKNYVFISEMNSPDAPLNAFLIRARSRKILDERK